MLLSRQEIEKRVRNHLIYRRKFNLQHELLHPIYLAHLQSHAKEAREADNIETALKHSKAMWKLTKDMSNL